MAQVCLSSSGLGQRSGVSISPDILLSCGNEFMTIQTTMHNVGGDDGPSL